MSSWGIVGLGEMGLPMALNLARAGLSPAVYDLRSEPVAEAVRAGAHAAETPAALAASADVVGLVVRDEAQTLAALLGEAGLLAGGAPGRLLVLHSTVGPSGARRIAEEAARVGHRLLDAPVSGMRMAAEAGTLSFLVGGDAADLERARAGLEAMGKRIFHLGPVGAGQAGKLANNLVSLSTVMFVAEGVALAKAEGLAEERVLEVLAASSGDSWIVRNWQFVRHRWRNEHPLGGPGVADMVGKDLRLALELAAELSLPVPAAALAAQLVPRLVAHEEPFAPGEA